MTALLQDLVRDQAHRRPEAIAITLGTESLTYGDLERRSNQLARVLLAVGCRRSETQVRGLMCQRIDRGTIFHVTEWAAQPAIR